MCKFLVDTLDLEKLERDEKDKLRKYFEDRKKQLQDRLQHLDRAIEAVKK